MNDGPGDNDGKRKPQTIRLDLAGDIIIDLSRTLCMSNDCLRRQLGAFRQSHLQRILT
jgi:hypothetical protein